MLYKNVLQQQIHNTEKSNIEKRTINCIKEKVSCNKVIILKGTERDAVVISYDDEY